MTVTLHCGEKHRLQEEFLSSVRELNLLQTQQMKALLAGDHDFTRFDILIHMAQEKKDAAKYAWIAHVEHHRCGEEIWH